MSRLRRHDLWIFGLAAVVRILWWIFGAELVWGSRLYDHPDTWAFVEAGRNLQETGTYTNDPGFSEGVFTRVPGYSLVWAVLSFLPGSTFTWNAILNILMDSATTVLLSRIGGQISPKASWLTGAAYALYPFSLFWVTTALPDTATTLTMVLPLWWATTREASLRNVGWFGAMVGVAALFREYAWVVLAALVPWVHASPFVRVREFAVACMCAAIVYSPWPLRNGILHGEWVVLRAGSTGYRQYDRDTQAVIKWMGYWTTLPDPHLAAMAAGEPVKPPNWVYEDASERAAAEALFARGRECGNGLRLWGGKETVVPDCTAEVADRIGALSAKLARREPLRVWVWLPMLNLEKILFKSSLVDAPANPVKALAVYVLFAYRTLLLLLGFGAALVLRNRSIAVVAFPAVALYLAMAFVLRGIQMRYLLQADVMMLLPAALGALALAQRATHRKQHQHE